ncbi:hypothetical protein DXG01_000657, partial [Tephrocybe rancida]
TFDHSTDRNKYGTIRGYDSAGWMSLALHIFDDSRREEDKIFLYNLDNSLSETAHLIISDRGPFVKSTTYVCKTPNDHTFSTYQLEV